MKKAVHLIIKGRVQGVGYRWFVRQVAERLNITGFVRNLPNGDVEVAAAGEEEALDQFIFELRHGSTFAHVLDMDIETVPVEEIPFDSFQITF